MRYRNGLTFSIQALTILVLSGAATYAFSSSFVFQSLASIAYPLQPVHLSIITAGFLVLAGILLIIVKQQPNSGLFVSLVALFCVPSVLAHSALDWARLVGAGEEIETGLNVGSALLLAVLVVTGYLLLRFTARFNQSALVAADLGYDRREVESIYSSQHLWGAAVAVGAAILGIIIFLLANLIERNLGGNRDGLSAIILPVGIFCTMALAVVAYWIVTRGRSRIQPVQEKPDL